MKKSKRGQFYLIAVLIVITIFIGLVTIVNSTKKSTNVNIFGLEDEIKIERRNVIDYISFENLTDAVAEEVFTNFSKEFRNKIERDKTVIFIFGKQDSIKLVGNQVSGTTISYDVGGGLVNLEGDGEFEEELAVLTNTITIQIDEIPYEFELFEGQNIYYLIKYNYDKEVYIIDG